MARRAVFDGLRGIILTDSSPAALEDLRREANEGKKKIQWALAVNPLWGKRKTP
jgi:hypothetical protein